tara:strand:- start:904 stop:1989 length:1086 start_codon:yes stop_codon:yes gene_type:complete
MFSFFGRKRLVVVGAGNAGCVTALHYHKYLDPKAVDIIIYHDPDTPIEKVGQGTVIGPTSLIGDTLGINWYSNPINATLKSGVLYEGWGKKKEKIFHNFPMDGMAMHYVPQKLSDAVLNSGKFKVVEKKVNNVEKEIDADVIFDCRGGGERNPHHYKLLTNPLNSVLLSTTYGSDPELLYTKAIATPNGWAFAIPNKDSVSYGYLYNNDITTKEEATEDFLERFNLSEIVGDFSFENYVARNMFANERTVLNGNKYFFLEPLEATALDTYQMVARYAWSHFVDGAKRDVCNIEMMRLVKEVQNFVLWHYQSGSKYDTPFWDYAKSLSFDPGPKFKKMFKKNTKEQYGNWSARSFKIWRDNT